MEKAKKQYPTDEEVARVMAERKLNRIGAVQYLRRQSTKASPVTQPKEPTAKSTGRKLKYNPERILKLWEDGKSIREIAEIMKPISSVFVHRTLTTKFRKQYDQGQKERAATREAAKKGKS
jgi:Helix-turn-helix domain of resolvase